MKAAGLALALAVTLAAQAPRFEVVSIRAVPPNAPPVMREIDFTPVRPGGRYVDSRTGLVFLISFAYDIRFPGMQLSGLPNWAKGTSYAVSAKSAEGSPEISPAENRERVRLMMRAMLEDRFQLRIRSETREEDVYELEVAKGGFQFKEVDPPEPPAKELPVGAAFSNHDGRIVGKKSTMAGMANALTVMLRRPVIDRTGLKGHYDFNVKWSSPDTADSDAPFGGEGIGLLISTLQHEFGLQLKKAKGPVQYWVVDRVEPPTEN